MGLKKVRKLILGVFIISTLFSGFNSYMDTEDPPLIVQDVYIGAHLV